MKDSEILRKQLTAEHHAVLFGVLAKNLINIYKEEAKELITKSVKQYGEQRGKRMALRVEKDGREKNILNYMCYGEWKANDGDMDIRTEKISPNLNLKVYKCPWYTSWKERNMLEYGCLYCNDIDESLVRGYNIELKLEVLKNRLEGSRYCDFSFKDAFLKNSDFEDVDMIKNSLGNSAIMEWDYHIGHIYKVIKENTVSKYGEKGNFIIEQSLNEFGDFYNRDLIDIIKEYDKIDFNNLPKLENGRY